jgi:quinol monooxygenase YgiN
MIANRTRSGAMNLVFFVVSRTGRKVKSLWNFLCTEKLGVKMHLVHVHIHVKTEFVEAFKQVTLENAAKSVKETGNIRFDVLQQAEDPTRFILVEIYRTAEASAAHKETAHYRLWRDAVMKMMAEPRQGIRFVNLFPQDADW